MDDFIKRLNNMPPEKLLYTLQALPSHLMHANQGMRLNGLLNNFAFMQAKLDAVGLQPLIDDYDLISIPGLITPADLVGLILIRDVFQLSKHILTLDKTQLRSQLYGRLMTQQVPAIQKLLEKLKLDSNSAWLRPLTSDMVQPGGELLFTLAGHTNEVVAVAVTMDSRFALSASVDTTIKVWDLERGVELLTLRGHTGPVRAVAVMHKSKRIISAGGSWYNTPSDTSLFIMRPSLAVGSNSTTKAVRFCCFIVSHSLSMGQSCG